MGTPRWNMGAGRILSPAHRILLFTRRTTMRVLISMARVGATLLLLLIIIVVYIHIVRNNRRYTPQDGCLGGPAGGIYQWNLIARRRPLCRLIRRGPDLQALHSFATPVIIIRIRGTQLTKNLGTPITDCPWPFGALRIQTSIILYLPS